MHYKKRFARCHSFQFLLFNQAQRHAALRNVSMQAKKAPGTFSSIEKLLMRQDIQDMAKEALSDPQSAAGIRLMKAFQPHINHSASALPFSAAARQADLSKLIGMIRFYGLPSYFLTISPCETDIKFRLRLAGDPTKPVENYDEARDAEVTFTFQRLNERRKDVSGNPYATAESFNKLIEHVIEILIGSSIDANVKKDNSTAPHERLAGINGISIAHFSICETQREGALHVHIALWGGMPPSFLQRVAHLESIAAHLASCIDSQVSGEVSFDAHLERAVRVSKKAANPRFGLYAVPTQSIGDLRTFVNKCACQLQNHDKHSFTCKKPPIGRTQCRVAQPRPMILRTSLVELQEPPQSFDEVHAKEEKLSAPSEASVSLNHPDNAGRPFPERDNRLIALQIKRSNFTQEEIVELEKYACSDDKKRLPPSNGNITEFSVTLTACVKCNTCNSCLGNENEATTGRDFGSFFLILFVCRL